MTPLELARAHPVGWAVYASRGRWRKARHLEYLGGLLVRLARGEILRLCVSMPPRHGKSELISKYFPSWFLGSHPGSRVILCSYGQALTYEWSRAARDAFAEHAEEVFGLTTWTRASPKSWDVYEAGRRCGGALYAVGKGGALTGRGADLAVCDDLVKDRDEVSSIAQRDRAWEWFVSVPLTRLQPGGRAVVVQTRWHHDDVVGRLKRAQERGQLGEPWTFVNLPCLAEDEDPLGRAPGEALWPETWPASWAAEKAREVGSLVWASLYQGHPTPIEGGMFKSSWTRLYQRDGDVLRSEHGTVRLSDLVRYATCDLAASTRTTADYTVFATWGVDRVGRRLYLLDLVRERLEGPDLVPRLRAVLGLWGGVAFVEKIGFQTSLIQEARRAGLPVRELRPDGDKVTRALPATAALEGGQVLFREGAPWLADLLEELATFPGGEHDDQVDALAYGVQVFLRSVRAAGIVRAGYAPDGRGDERGSGLWTDSASRDEAWLTS